MMPQAGPTENVLEDSCVLLEVSCGLEKSANTNTMGHIRSLWLTTIPVRGTDGYCVPHTRNRPAHRAKGDKLWPGVIENFKRESIVAVHSVGTSAGGGGVRWYEFRLDKNRNPQVYQQGTYAPDKFYRWMASPAMDRNGNIGIGYSFGGTPNFPGQRFAARLANDPLGQLTLQETVLMEGEGVQNVMRWEDYTQTAVDPSDDCTIWYVGDYIKKGETNY